MFFVGIWRFFHHTCAVYARVHALTLHTQNGQEMRSVSNEQLAIYNVEPVEHSARRFNETGRSVRRAKLALHWHKFALGTVIKRVDLCVLAVKTNKFIEF